MWSNQAELRKQIPPPSPQRNGKSSENRLEVKQEAFIASACVLEEDRVPNGIGKASAGTGRRELERKALPHLLHKRRSGERMKVSFREPKVLSVEHEDAPAKPLVRLVRSTLSSAREAQSPVETGSRMNSRVQEFFDSVPKELRNSTAFLGMLSMATEKLKTTQLQNGVAKAPSGSR
jgi:hypothetical protein